MKAEFIIYLLIMAGTTYLIRLLPMLFIRRKIENEFIRSFLYYVPYSVLTVMTFPAAFFATDSIISAAVGVVVASLLALRGKGLVTVAFGSASAILLCDVVQIYLLPILQNVN